MWAHERQPDPVAYGAALGHEWFSPRELLDQAVKAERAEFDLACGSDHLAPWWDPSGVPPAHCANLGWPLPPHASPPRASSQGQQDVASCPS